MNILVINIDSRFRDKTIFPNPNYFQLELPDCVKDVVTLRLSSVEYPNVEKLIQPARENDTFAVNGDWFTLPEGSYSAYQLVKALNNIVSYLNISVTSNDFTGQVTFESTTDSTFTLTFPKGFKGYPSLGNILGFCNDTYTDSDYYVSESTINVAADSYIFLRVNDFGSVVSPSVDGMKRAFAKVVLTTGVFTMVMDNGSNLITKKHECEQPLTVYKLTIELLDYLGYRLQSNSNYSFTLELTYITNSYLKDLANAPISLSEIGSLLPEDESHEAKEFSTIDDVYYNH